MYSAFVEHKLRALMECAARSSYLVIQPWKAFPLWLVFSAHTFFLSLLGVEQRESSGLGSASASRCPTDTNGVLSFSIIALAMLSCGGCRGTMEPIVFIHGIFQMLGNLPVDRVFAPRPALIPDMLGYGTQAGVSVDRIFLEAQADDLAAQIHTCGHTKAHIVGHSVGGAVAMLLARRHAEIVASVLNVEGNFTIEDAFWTGKLAAMTLPQVSALLESYQNDVSGWLTRAGIEPTSQRIAIASCGLHAQPATTVKAMAQSVIETTAQPSYLNDVHAVLDYGIPLHLIAGEHSSGGWHVPESVLCRAASMTVQPQVGHMMMLEAPEEFLGLIANLIA